MTYAADIARIKNAQTLGEIQDVARQYSAIADGEGGVLYSRTVGDVPSEVIAKELAQKTGLPIINDTPRAQFLGAASRTIDQSARRIFEGQGQDPVLAKQSAEGFLYGDAKAAARSATSLDGCLWGETSREFAGSLRGDIKVVASAATPDRVFGRVELPAALGNPQINSLGGRPIANLQATYGQGGVEAVLPEVQAKFIEAAPRGIFISPDKIGKSIAEVELSKEFATVMGADSSKFARAADLSASGVVVRAPIGASTTAAAIDEAAIAARAAVSRSPVSFEGESRIAAGSAPESGVAQPAGRQSGLVKGVGIAGVAATVYDGVSTTDRAWQLHQQGNAVGAQSEVLRFGARNVGGWTGAVVGLQAGALLGIESGPGAVLTGIAGAGVGAWGANKVVDWVEQHRINTQSDRSGNTWRFDPEHPDKGWTREVVDAFVERGLSIKHTEIASPTQTNELNYKASSMAVQLRLAAPDIPVDPYRIAADARDTRSLRESPWVRDPQNHQWTREVADGLIDRTMHTYTQTADPQKAAELDAHAQSIVAYNAARSPTAIAANYEQAHAQSNWSQYGPVPEAVVHARSNVNTLQASDGNAYTRGKNGEWTHDGLLYDSKAAGNVRDELNATYKSLHNSPAVEVQKPSTPAPSSAPVNQHSRHQSSTDMRDPDHPGHREYQHALDAVHRYEGSQSIPSGQHSEILAAHLAAMGEREKFNLHHLEKGAEGQLIAVQSGPYVTSDPERRIGISTQAALSQSVEQYSAQFSASRSPHYASNAPAAERTQEQSQALAQLSPTDQQMFARIRDGVPAHISDDVVASALYAAKKEGIDRPDKIGDAMMVGDRLFVAGTTPGFRAAVNVSESVPSTQETVQQTQTLNQQQLLAQQQQQEFQSQQQTRSGSTMTI